MRLETAERDYYAWTNVLLTNARTKARRSSHFWAYVQVTERQHKTRQHPHSHILTTFLPDDAVSTTDDNGREAFISRWFTRANESAGLGSQHRISCVDSPMAVSRYVAKYLFKDTMNEKYPPKWKRVRYSQNFPSPVGKFFEFTAVLNTSSGWKSAADYPATFQVDDPVTWEMALKRMVNVRLLTKS